MDESCLPQSQSTPNNARFSLSKTSEEPSVVGMQKSLPRAYDDPQKLKETSSGDRNSLSEFEFAMCATAHDGAHGVVHMLAADELFFKGKLLPLYVPEFIDGPELKTGSCNACDQADQLPKRVSCNQQVLADCKPMTPNCPHEGNPEDLAVKSLDIIPTSPKAPRCSIKLKSIFGLKKFARSYCSCAASGEVNIASSSSPAKLSRRKVHKTEKSKHRSPSAALILEQNVPLSVGKARYLTCQMSDMNSRNSASEPLLRFREAGGKELHLPLGCSLDTPKINLQAHSLKCPENLMQRFNAGTSCNWCNAADISCKQGCNNKVRDTDVDTLATHKNSDEVRFFGRSSEDVRRLASRIVSHEEVHTCTRGCGEEFCRESWKLTHERNVGELSLERTGSYGLLDAAHGSPKQLQDQATPASLINGFRSLSISRAKSLESRSSSYSPKSLQRKYDQLKLTRQREGWRVLERSSSYNGSMHSMRVAPVLNVPIVCMSRSKSSNNATDPGRGQSLFPTRKNLDVNFRVVSGTSSSRSTASSKLQLKLLQSRRQSPHVMV